jgi:hypothetical protein
MLCQYDVVSWFSGLSKLHDAWQLLFRSRLPFLLNIVPQCTAAKLPQSLFGAGFSMRILVHHHPFDMVAKSCPFKLHETIPHFFSLWYWEKLASTDTTSMHETDLPCSDERLSTHELYPILLPYGHLDKSTDSRSVTVSLPYCSTSLRKLSSVWHPRTCSNPEQLMFSPETRTRW